jgi:hypothetical protein
MRNAQTPRDGRPVFTSFALIAILALVALAPPAARAQQPFYTDDTDVTPKGKLHLEFSNQLDFLQRSSFPNLRQNSASFELGYGLFKSVEVSIETPLLTIFNARGTRPRTAVGIGDTNLSVKYNFRQERESSRLPAMSVSVSVELPTGDTARQVGSGVADFSFNAIAQKSLIEKIELRFNGGTIFSGNTLTGAAGLRTRGGVFTGGASLVREFTPKLSLGTEVTGARTRNSDLGKGQLQTQVGGNYVLRDGLTFDFGVITALYAASPRLGLQIGISTDF